MEPATDQASSPGPFGSPVRATGPWAAWWRGWYRLIRLAGGPLDRLALRPGFGNLVVLRVVGRRSGRERALPLGLLSVGGERYLGHPSGDTAWTLNLRAAGTATIESARIPRTRVTSVVLGPGLERDAVVRATFRQHPFPGNVMYRVAGRHVSATGIFFRLVDGRDADETASAAGQAAAAPSAGRAADAPPTGRAADAPLERLATDERAADGVTDRPGARA